MNLLFSGFGAQNICLMFEIPENDCINRSTDDLVLFCLNKFIAINSYTVPINTSMNNIENDELDQINFY